MPSEDDSQTIALRPQHLAEWALESHKAALSIKRGESRHEAFPNQVEVRVVKGNVPNGPTVHAQMRDVSDNGIGLILRKPIDDRSIVDLKMYQDGVCYAARGQVVHCTQTVGGYKVGLSLMFE